MKYLTKRNGAITTAITAALTAAIIFIGNLTITNDKVLTANYNVVTVSGIGTETDWIEVDCNGMTMQSLKLTGKYIHVQNCIVDAAGISPSHGVFISGQHIIFEDSTVKNMRTASGNWGSGVKCYFGGEDVVIRGNKVYNNMGEGIGITRCIGVEVDANEVWDNYSVNIYIDNSIDVTVTGNYSHCSDPKYYRDGYPATGILLGNERYTTPFDWGSQLRNVTIDGNTIQGCRPIRLYNPINGAVSGFTITNNTFIGVTQPFVSVAGAVTSNNVAGKIINVPADYPTIKAAVSAAVDGTIINVSAGTYIDQVEITKNNITLKAAGKVATKSILISGNHNTVQGFTISDVTSNYGIMVTGANNLFIDNEIFHTKQDGIWFFGHDNTFRGNYVHDILDPSITGDPHADCFQTWGSQWETYNIMFDGNKCDHTRAVGSNQIVMIENQSSWAIHDITFENNVFITVDAGALMNFHRKDGQREISRMYVLNNTFENTTLAGIVAVKFSGISGGAITGNTSTGYIQFAQLTNGSIAVINNNNPLTPVVPTLGTWITLTPTVTKTPVPTNTATPTATSTPTFTPTATQTVMPTITPSPTLTATTIPTPSKFYVIVAYRGTEKVLNMRYIPSIFGETLGVLYPYARVQIVQIVRGDTINQQNVWGKIGEGVYIPLFYNNVYYTDWRK